jgi:hypothetical protein
VMLRSFEQKRGTFSIFLPLRGCNDEYDSYSTGMEQPADTTMILASSVDGDADITANTNEECQCHLPLNQEFKAQSGQDQYLFQRVFFPQGALCCRGVFVEFGARNGITHSNSYVYEKNLGWKGLLFEVDAKEHQELVHNRPNSDVVLGPVCPSHMDNVTIVLSNIPGFTGTIDTYGT